MGDYEVVDLPKDYEVVDLPKQKPYFSGMASHAKDSTAPMESSHIPSPSTAVQKAPEIDPGTGRQKTAGRTMTEKETAKWRTGAMVLSGATGGSLVGGAEAAAGLTGFAAQAIGRMIGATFGGAGGEAYGQLFEHAHGVGPETSGEAASRIGESAKDMAEMEGLGLGIEGVTKAVTTGIKAGGGKLYEALKKTDVYQKMVAAKAAAATERNLVVSKTAANTADEIANKFRQKPEPGSLNTRGPGLVKDAEERVTRNTNAMYDGFKRAISHKTVDYQDVAQMIVDIEKKTPRAKGGLSVMTEPDTNWRNFVDAMKAGNEQTVEEVEKAVTGKVGGDTITLKPAVSKTNAPANAAEAAPAVVDARGTISQRLAELKRQGNAPREYVQGLEKALEALDHKLDTVAGEVGPGVPELFKAAKDYYGKNREIQKQAMYKLMKSGGDIAGALMDADAPQGVAVLKAVAQETSDRTVVPIAQRAVIEKLLNPSEKGTDLARFNDRLAALGKTGEHLFSDPRASRVITGIKEQAAVLNRLEAIPRISGDTAESLVGKLLTHALPGALGYEAGKKVTGDFKGGMVGFGLGAFEGKRFTEYVLKLAENPNANRLFLKALSGADKTGEFSGIAVAQAARALKMVNASKPLGDYVKEKADALKAR